MSNKLPAVQAERLSAAPQPQRSKESACTRSQQESDPALTAAKVIVIVAVLAATHSFTYSTGVSKAALVSGEGLVRTVIELGSQENVTKLIKKLKTDSAFANETAREFANRVVTATPVMGPDILSKAGELFTLAGEAWESSGVPFWTRVGMASAAIGVSGAGAYGWTISIGKFAGFAVKVIAKPFSVIGSVLTGSRVRRL